MTDSRRVRMTKKMIKDAYLELLDRYPSDKITVTDICRVADVNRSTFYAYYADPIMLRKEIENDVLQQIPVVVNLADSIESQSTFLNMLERFFIYIRENERLFRVLLLQSDNRQFSRRLIETVLEKYQAEDTPPLSLLAEYGYIYCVSGVIGILGNWIEDGFPFTAKEFAEIAFKMSFQANEIVDQ